MVFVLFLIWKEWEGCQLSIAVEKSIKMRNQIVVGSGLLSNVESLFEHILV